MITSAGCNALDYLLDSPREIQAVDVNFRQNALLELKLALFARRNFDDLVRDVRGRQVQTVSGDLSGYPGLCCRRRPKVSGTGK